MGLFRRKQKKTWQQLKEEEEELERLAVEKERLEELGKQVEAPKLIQPKKLGFSEKELKKELKKYPRKKRKNLMELYRKYQNGEVSIPEGKI